MVVAGSVIGAPGTGYQKGDAETATHLQDADSGNIVGAHDVSENQTGGPERAEQRPGCRENALRIGSAFKVMKLLAVLQSADGRVDATDGEVFKFHVIHRADCSWQSQFAK